MKRHAPKTPKNTKALQVALWHRQYGHFHYTQHCEPARLKSAKGKKGFTGDWLESVRESGSVGKLDEFRFIGIDMASGPDMTVEWQA